MTSRLTWWLFLATVFTITFAKLHWAVAGDVALADVLTILFLVAFAFDRLARGDTTLPRTALTVLAFFAAFVAVYLVGFYNLET